MATRNISRTGAVARMLLYTTALPIAFAAVAVAYALINGGNG